jgi:hypothetical protein
MIPFRSLCVLGAAFFAVAPTAGSRTRQAAVTEMLARSPMRFEANQGQLDRRVKYFSKAAGYSLFLTPREAVLSIGKTTAALRISLPGANPAPHIEGADRLPSISNYFLGNRPERWRGNVPQYRRVRYRQLYPGIDLVYYGNGRQLEYDFTVEPGADPRRIRLRFAGAEEVRLDHSGDLVLRVGGAELRQRKPVAYQESRPVEARYVLRGRREAGICLGDYDPSKTLVIDPVVDYSTYLGGEGTDAATAVVVDAEGFIWVTGYTYSIEFPTAGDSYRNGPYGNKDLFVVKMDPSAPPNDAMVYGTYLGGSGDDEPTAIRLDTWGNVCVAGYTGSSDFPIAGNAFQTTIGGDRDVFVLKLNPKESGTAALEYSTFLGGSGADVAYALTLDASGNIYVAGYTTSADNFPVSSAPLQGSSRGGWEAFLSILDPSTSGSASLRYSTFLGGNSTDVATGVAVDASGKVYIAGYTMSDDFPITDKPYKGEYNGGGDVFLTVLDLSKPGLDALAYSTFLGGSGLDLAYRMALDTAGGVWLAGYTLSKDFPVTPNALQASNAGEADVFVARLDLALRPAESLTYVTYFGGSGSDVLYDMALDPSGKIFLAGYTTSLDFPVTASALQSAYGGAADAFVSWFDPSAPADQALLYSTYFGGGRTEVARAIALDAAGNVYLAGFTESAGLPVTEGAFRNSLNGLSDALLIKLHLSQ